MRDIDLTLQNAFSQRLIATQYDDINQYRIVLEANESRLRSEESLRQLVLVNVQGQQIPLTTFAQFHTVLAPLSVVHSGGFVIAGRSRDPSRD
jgi:multidrug efflux pump